MWARELTDQFLRGRMQGMKLLDEYPACQNDPPKATAVECSRRPWAGGRGLRPLVEIRHFDRFAAVACDQRANRLIANVIANETPLPIGKHGIETAPPADFPAQEMNRLGEQPSQERQRPFRIIDEVGRFAPRHCLARLDN